MRATLQFTGNRTTVSLTLCRRCSGAVSGGAKPAEEDDDLAAALAGLGQLYNEEDVEQPTVFATVSVRYGS